MTGTAWTHCSKANGPSNAKVTRHQTSWRRRHALLARLLTYLGSLRVVQEDLLATYAVEFILILSGGN